MKQKVDNTSCNFPSRCPVDREKRRYILSDWLTNISGRNAADTAATLSSSTASVEKAAIYSQNPQLNQLTYLNTEREVSSIPRGNILKHANTSIMETPIPYHQHESLIEKESQSNWVYPSEQQLYNAMIRKGWKNIPENSIPVVLQIHNAVNESTWAKVLEYHRFPFLEPRLVEFHGRPKDLTPKAWFISNVLGRPPPFDRHDWYVEYYVPSLFFVGPGQWVQQRYVIDFYDNSNRSDMSTRAVVDLRPAFDNPRATWLAVKRLLHICFPGVTNYYYQCMAFTSRSYSDQQHPTGKNSLVSKTQDLDDSKSTH